MRSKRRCVAKAIDLAVSCYNAGMSEIKYISPREFADRGYLQEVNRQFLHPLGLALEITLNRYDPSDEGRFSGVWDYREDPEGITFGGLEHYGLDAAKAQIVAEERRSKEGVRRKMFGQTVQPVFEDLDKR